MAIKLKAPEAVASLNIQGRDYVKDEDGFVTVHVASDVEELARFGCTDPTKFEVENHAVVVEVDGAELALSLEVELDSVKGELENANLQIESLTQQRDAASYRVTQLEADVASLTARLESPTPSLPAGEAPGDDPSGSAGAGTAETTADLPERPSDDAGRDDLVEWLGKQGVIVPSSISKVNAWKAVDDLYASKGA